MGVPRVLQAGQDASLLTHALKAPALLRSMVRGMTLARMAAMRAKDRNWDLSLLAILAALGLAVLVWLG